jgi:hypothetical protein
VAEESYFRGCYRVSFDKELPTFRRPLCFMVNQSLNRLTLALANCPTAYCAHIFLFMQLKIV